MDGGRKSAAGDRTEAVVAALDLAIGYDDQLQQRCQPAEFQKAGALGGAQAAAGDHRGDHLDHDGPVFADVEALHQRRQMLILHLDPRPRDRAGRAPRPSGAEDPGGVGPDPLRTWRMAPCETMEIRTTNLRARPAASTSGRDGLTSMRTNSAAAPDAATAAMLLSSPASERAGMRSP